MREPEAANLGSSAGTSSDRLPQTHFDTVSLPKPRRLQAWRDAIGVMFDAYPADPEAAEAPVTLDSWLLGPAVLTVASGPGFSYHRSLQGFAADGLDVFMVQFYAVGRCCIVRGAPTAASEPGDLVVTDLARSMATEETAFRNLNLLLPRRLLAPLLQDPDAQGGRVLRRDLPLVALARRHLEELVQQAPRLLPSEATQILDVTARLIAAALNGSTSEATAGGVKIALACQVRRFIEEHLDDRALTAEVLAAHFGVSRATIYRMFVKEGGVRRHVQCRRLVHAQRDLLSASQRHRTVAEIGAAAGYAHSQDFIRAYRAQFGVSPGNERERAHLERRHRLFRRRPELPAWAEWVRDLG